MNPFKFGTIVEEPYFTDRIEEIEKIKSLLSSTNHMIIISPRRYGKTSLINKVIKSTKRKHIYIDLQLITTPEDFASELLKRIYKIYPSEKIKSIIKNFRIMPVMTLHPVTNEIDVTFTPGTKITEPLEDVFDMLGKLASLKDKPVVIFDEFQELKKIENGLDKKLRSKMQYHKNINYVFLGSQESLIREIFESKKSPFYHFGYLYPLKKIPYNDFKNYLFVNFRKISKNPEQIIESILNYTKCHPYYTQKLAFTVWERIEQKSNVNAVETAKNEIIRNHDIDYERLWNTINRTEMKILIGLAESGISPLTEEFKRQHKTGAVSTTYSSIKKMLQDGILTKEDKTYEFDDPFFKQWLINRRRGRSDI